MDLTPYVDNLRRELAVAAEAGGDDARALAERLTAPLASAIRLTLLDALSVAADEITRDLAPGSVELRLRGGDVTFAVSAPALDPPASVDQSVLDPTPKTAAESGLDEDGPMARINLRLPEYLKTRIEEAAGVQGRSVNTWLVRAATAALQPQSPPLLTERSSRSAQHYTGWVR
ncbi:MAG TPA: hypothetical protein VHH34_06980 [Pseudonocardiaceae bacterium]|nr:hypothetical protein [Pseudonocardiaceae bacterium]